MSYFANRIKYRAALLASVVLLLAVMLLSSTIGIADIGVLEALNIVASKVPGAKRLLGNDIVESTQAIIVLNIRMPRIFLAAAIGALLSIIGGCFQGLFKNPMADPYVLGISNGAGLGATIAIVFGLNISWNVLGLGMVSIMAFAGAFVTAVTVFAIARVGGRLPTVNLLLTGIAVGLFEYSIITILMVFNRDKIEGIIMWLMGSVNAANWQQVGCLVPAAAIGTVVLSMFAKALNAISSGDDTARSLGINVEAVRKVLFAICSMLVAICVSVSGIIGFVGLVVPHATRLITGPDHRAMLPFSAIGGAIFLVICDTLARSVIPPVELPVGAVTSLFGAPYFIWLLLRAKKKEVQRI